MPLAAAPALLYENGMTSPIPSWPRPQYSPSDGRPFILYLVFGSFGTELSPSQSKHHVAGVPAGLRVDGFSARESGLEPFFNDEPFVSQLRGDPALQAVLASAPSCLRFIGELADQPTLDYLRDVVGLVVAALEAGGVAVLDPQQLAWWSAAEFRATYFEPVGPAVLDHVAFLASDDGDGATWLHTRGMRKFGRPDVSVHGVASQEREATVDLMERLVQSMAWGAVVPEGQPIRMASLAAGMTCHHEGDVDDPEFNNVRIEVRRRRG